MKKSIAILIAFVLGGFSPAGALDPVPATTEDRQKYDDSLSDDLDKVDDNPGASDRGGKKSASDGSSSTDDHPGAHHRRRRGRGKKDNFGAKVSAEAQQRNADGDKKEFGKWVSDQKRKDGKRSKGEDDGTSRRGRGSDDAAEAGSGSDDGGHHQRGKNR